MPLKKHLEGQGHADAKEEKEWHFMPALEGLPVFQEHYFMPSGKLNQYYKEQFGRGV